MGMALLALLVMLLMQFAMAGVAEPSGQSIASSPEDEAYAAGYRDAAQGLEFGTSKPLPKATASSGFGFGSMISLLFVGKTLFDLGRTEAGWEPRMALERARCMPRTQQVLFGFMLLRLVGASPI